MVTATQNTSYWKKVNSILLIYSSKSFRVLTALKNQTACCRFDSYLQSKICCNSMLEWPSKNIPCCF